MRKESTKRDHSHVLDREEHEEMCHDAEDDAIGVPVSFILMEVTRRLITGHYPSHGNDPVHNNLLQFPHSGGAIGLMVLASSLYLLVAFALGKIRRDLEFAGEHAAGNSSNLLTWLKFRIIAQSTAVFIFTSSWLMIFQVQMFLQLYWNYESANVVIRLTTAALTTFTCIILLYAFDSIAHSFHAQGKHSWAAAVSNILRALGITIGFAWERAFGEAKRAIEIRCGQYFAGEISCLFNNNGDCLNNISDKCPQNCLTYANLIAIINAVLLWALFVPAVKWHIGPKMHDAEQNSRHSAWLDSEEKK